MSSRAALSDPRTISPVDAFGRLFENEFITLESVAISARTLDGIDHLDAGQALPRLLDDAPAEGPGTRDPMLHALHVAMLRAWADVEAVVSGRPRHLQALLAEGFALPAATSPMINRGVTDLSRHLVDLDALLGSGQAQVLAHARRTAEEDGMKHVLLITGDGLVCAAGPTMHETMAHYSNVAFAASVECLRIEEQLTHLP